MGVASRQVNLATNGGIAGDGLQCLVLQKLQYVNTSDSSPIVNVTAETFFNQTCTIPANFFFAGMGLRITAVIKYNAAGVLPTLTLRSYVGTSVLATPSMSVVTSGTNRVIMTATWLCRTAGASGTFVRWGDTRQDTVSLAALGILGASGESTLDTTVSNVVRTSAQWSALNLGNTATLETMAVELLR